jgi:5-hydroxyisourate hydrolase
MGYSAGISIHAVDVARGCTAAGMRVTLHELGTPERLVADGVIGANGVLDHPSASGEGTGAGIYEVRFHIGDYCRAIGITEPFLEIAPFRFTVRDASQHVHLPLKFTPYGYSIYRGA